MTGKVTESIFNGETFIIPLADIQMFRKDKAYGTSVEVIFKSSFFDDNTNGWSNSVWVHADEAVALRKAWCRYRAELEADTLMNLEPE